MAEPTRAEFYSVALDAGERRPFCLFVAAHHPGGLSYLRWDRATRAWRDDPEVSAFVYGGTDGLDVRRLERPDFALLAAAEGTTLEDAFGTLAP